MRKEVNAGWAVQDYRTPARTRHVIIQCCVHINHNSGLFHEKFTSCINGDVLRHPPSQPELASFVTAKFPSTIQQLSSHVFYNGHLDLNEKSK